MWNFRKNSEACVLGIATLVIGDVCFAGISGGIGGLQGLYPIYLASLGCSIVLGLVGVVLLYRLVFVEFKKTSLWLFCLVLILWLLAVYVLTNI